MKRSKARNRWVGKSARRRRSSPELSECLVSRMDRMSTRLEEVVEELRDIKKGNARLGRIGIEKKLFKAAWGNMMFAHELCKRVPTEEDAQSVLRRLSYLTDICSRLLSCDAVCPIIPTVGQKFDASVHRALGTVQVGANDAPGDIAECLEVGFIDSGVATPAEVVVFAENK